MILYDNKVWHTVVFKYTGTVWPQIGLPLFLLTWYAIGSYAFAVHYEFNIGNEGELIFGSTMSFLLIFRANQAYTRYWEGRTHCAYFFSDLRDFLMLCMLYMRGGIFTSLWLFRGGGASRIRCPIEDEFDIKARIARVDLMRLTIALAVSFKLHTRICLEGYCFGSISKENKWLIDYDRLRLRQLLTDMEFRIVDAYIGIDDPNRVSADKALKKLVNQFRNSTEPPESWPDEFECSIEPTIRPTVIIIFLLREAVLRNMNQAINDQPWGIKERFVPALSTLLDQSQKWYEMVNQIITTPLPLPYANLCKTLLALFLLSLPFFVDYKLGRFANTVVPPMVSLALLGIDAIATELENPFGDDANDLDVLELIHVLESEAMEMLSLTGDEAAVDLFVWRKVPQFISQSSSKPLNYQLAVRRHAASDVFLDGTELSEAGSYPLDESFGSTLSNMSALNSNRQDGDVEMAQRG